VKNTIVYSVIFLLAFGLVTGALFYFNGQFNSMFEFDFSPPKQEQTKLKPAVADSLKSDSTKVMSDSSAVHSDSTANHSLPNNAVAAVNSAEKSTSKSKTEVTPVTDNPMVPKTNMRTVVNRDSIYKSWVAETVKLYEVMDSKKAAKVIMGYSDNIARDIILKMKKKKAAEILAELKPEVVTRIISVN
jgi:flagellar motility protein MotE (MotC chaperone)